MEKIERPVMTEEEFKEYIKAGYLKLFAGVPKYKSVFRAQRRGHISPIGEPYPKRPFNNRKATKGREINEKKKLVYARIRQFSN